jgi:hypothetical protein
MQKNRGGRSPPGEACSEAMPPLCAEAIDIIVAHEAFDFAHGLSDDRMATHSIRPRPENDPKAQIAWQTAFNKEKKRWQNARRRSTYASLWSKEAPSSEATKNVARWWMPRLNDKV